MPDLSAAPTRAYTGFTVGLRDFTGKSSTIRITAGADADAAALAAVRTAAGNMSNARVMEYSSQQGIRQINPANPANTTFDEAYATVDVRAVFIFQDDEGNVEYVKVPAPDASIFLPDGETVQTPVANALVLALTSAVVAALNDSDPAGTFIYVRAYREGTASRSRIPLPIEEPGGGDSPPDAPGV